MAHEQFDLALRMEPGADAAQCTSAVNILGPMDDDLAAALQEKVRAAVHHGLDVRPALGADPRCSCPTAC